MNNTQRFSGKIIAVDLNETENAIWKTNFVIYFAVLLGWGFQEIILNMAFLLTGNVE